MPITAWRHYADPRLAPYGRSLTVLENVRQGDPGDPLPSRSQAGGEKVHRLPELELRLRIVPEDREGHVVVRAQRRPRVGLHQDGLQAL